MKYIIGHELPSKNDASVKAHIDIDHFLMELQYKSLVFETRQGSNKISREFKRLISIMRLRKKVEKNDTIVIHYPIYSSKLDIDLFYKNVVRRADRRIAIIHDLAFLRDSNPPIQKDINLEICRLNMFNVVIVHNHAMGEILKHYGLTAHVVELGIFDYRGNDDGDATSMKNGKHKIFFAGNLNKSSFVQYVKSDETVEYNFWGSIDDPKKLDTSVVYHGVVPSEVLPTQLKNGWGLVWDGDSADAVSGLGGNYLKYIDPHKTSLYLVSGVPVIVWGKAGVADFIEKHHLGITVNSLSEISTILSNMSGYELSVISKSVQNYKKKLLNGKMTQTAVQKAEYYLDEVGARNGN